MEPNHLPGPDVHFEHFGGLDPYIARMNLRKLIFSMLHTGPRYCQDDAQDAHFEYFGGLAPDIAKMGVRMLFLRTLAA